MRTREEQRQEEEKYQSDVVYEVWQSGGNVDSIDRDRVQADYYDGRYPWESATRYRRHRHEWPEQEYPEEVE